MEDLAQFQATMLAIERACGDIQIQTNLAEAETTIVSLHQSSNPYRCCRFILENSQLASARFQAAGAIQDAAMREWGTLLEEDKKGLIFFCIWFAFKNASTTDGYVQNKVSSVAALLIKRGWLELTATDKESIFSEVRNTIFGMHGTNAQFAAINFLESLVSEFLPSTSSSMGLPAEFHESCRSSFERDYLQKFYCWTQEAALGVAGEVLECRGDTSSERVCSVAFRFMFQALNWEFQCASKPALTLKNKVKQPGPLWHNVLIFSGHITWLLGLYDTMRVKCSGNISWSDSPLAVSARQLIVQFCSLSGIIFPSDHGQTQEKHLLQILSAVHKWMDPPALVVAAIRNGRPESELVDGCHTLLAIATVAGSTLFDDLLKPIRHHGTVQFLSNLTCEVIQAQGAHDSEEDTWCSDVLDVLLETWNVILSRTDNVSYKLSSEGLESINRLFNTIVESQLKAAVSSVFDEVDDSEHFHASVAARDERLGSFALIARKVASASLPLLIGFFSERFSSLCQRKGVADPTCTLEELYWLLLISGHILTDFWEGETTTVPDDLLSAFSDVTEATKHPVVVLSWSIIKFAEQSLDPEMRANFFSPRLMEAIVWFLSRWIGTYLMPGETTASYEKRSHPEKNLLLTFASEDSEGRSLLDIFVRISLVVFTSYPGEIELLTLTCQHMLPALVRRKNICLHLVTLNSWRSMSNAFVNEHVLFTLPSRLQRSLAESLVTSVSALRESQPSDQYIKDLMGPIVAYLVDLCSKDNLRATSQQPDTIFMVCCILERLRGAARATESRTQMVIFDLAVSAMDSVLTLLGVYKDEAEVVHAILKFALELVDAQVAFLSPKDMATLVNFCMKLLQIFSSQNIGKISISTSSSLLIEAKVTKYKGLRALIQLLAHLCTKDLVDFSTPSPEEESTNVAEVVFLGLHIIMPLVSVDLLKYPKLCKDYFELLSHMMEVYPEKVAQLNADAFKHVVSAIDFGIRQQDSDVVDMCLRAVAALSSYHYGERIGSRQGLGGFALSAYGQEGFTSHFLRLLLHLILFEDFSMELAGSAADALLPLLVCEPDLYQRLSQEAIETRVAHPSLRPRLAIALQSLTSSNQLSASLDRVNRQRFRKNLSQMLIDVSGFMRLK